MPNTNHQELLDKNYPQIYFGTSAGGLAQLKDGKHYYIVAPDIGEAKIGDEVPAWINVWPARSPLLEFP